MIVITTPTGDIGHQILERVIQGSEPIRVVVRSPARIPQELRERVEVVQGSHGEPEVIERALAGADALFWLVPPEPLMTLNSVEAAYGEFTKPAADAIRKHEVQRVVSVAGIARGWQKNAGLATANIKAIDVLADTKVALRALMLPSFMENLLRQAATIVDKGVFSHPILPELKAPMVATCDIAAVAANFLLDTEWTGQADVPVLGPEDISPNEMAELLSHVLGCPVRYEQTPIDVYKARMISRGMSEAFAQDLADMMTAKNEGLDNIAPRAAAAHTPTTFGEWSKAVLKSAVARQSRTTSG